jgi:hypothetical protein
MQVKLQTLVSMFDGDGDGLLGEVDTLRLLRFARPSLTDKQLDKCLIQVGVEHTIIGQMFGHMLITSMTVMKALTCRMQLCTYPGQQPVKGR